MFRLALPIVATLILSIAHAGAQTSNPVDCGKATSTVEMNYCAELDYDKADRLLNDAYQKALTQIAGSDGSPPYTAAAWEKEFRASQRAWIAFRDADCKGLVPMEWSGGTGTSSAVLGCMTELTSTRTKALRDRYGRR